MNDPKRRNRGDRSSGDPRKTAHLLLIIAVLTMGFASYWHYNAAHREGLDSFYRDLLGGTAPAPEQYRVGVVLLAQWMARCGLALRHSLTIIDTVAASIGVLTLFYLLRRSETYQAASTVRRWFAAAAFVLLVQFYFAWVLWYQRPETLPSVALIALTLLLLTVPPPLPASFPKPLVYLATAIPMLLLAVLQGWVRADVGFALHAGIFLVCLTRAGKGLSLPRSIQAMTSALAVVATGGIQYHLMHFRYPHATYGAKPVIVLVLNLTSPSEWVSLLLFIVPYAWTVRQAMKMRGRLQGPGIALLGGSVVFLVMWLLLGRVGEVRIFLPFALALAPLTVEFNLNRLLPAQSQTAPGE